MIRMFLNGFLFNDPVNRVYIDEPLEGLSLPAVRTSQGQNAGQSGGYVGAQFDDMRFITINGHIFSSSVAEAYQKRRELQEHLPLYPETITVQIYTDDERSYELEAQYVDFKMPITTTRFKHVFKLDLIAPNPGIKDTTGGSLLTATIQKAIPGGYQFTATSPQFGGSYYFSESQSMSTVTNTGSSTTYPVITLTGKLTNPILVNRTTGETFKLTGYAVTDPADVTVIDMANHTVKLNGGNVFGYVPLDSQWWGFVPGDNIIDFTSDSGSDITAGSAEWNPVVRGI